MINFNVGDKIEILWKFQDMGSEWYAKYKCHQKHWIAEGNDTSDTVIEKIEIKDGKRIIYAKSEYNYESLYNKTIKKYVLIEV